MTQEEKLLLLIDLCARLTYGVVVNTGDKDLKLDRTHQNIGILYPEDCSKEFNERSKSDCYIIISGCYYGEDVKPYLRPMSSMTEDEKLELEEIFRERIDSSKLGITIPPNSTQGKLIPFIWMSEVQDWLNSHHFDYRGLIEKGLALPAPPDMYKF